jgi:hypothetical protein
MEWLSHFLGYLTSRRVGQNGSGRGQLSVPNLENCHRSKHNCTAYVTVLICYCKFTCTPIHEFRAT